MKGHQENLEEDENENFEAGDTLKLSLTHKSKSFLIKATMLLEILTCSNLVQFTRYYNLLLDCSGIKINIMIIILGRETINPCLYYDGNTLSLFNLIS